MVHFAPGAKPVPQLLRCSKSVAFEPVTAMLLIVRGVLLILVNNTSTVELFLPTLTPPKFTSVFDKHGRYLRQHGQGIVSLVRRSKVESTVPVEIARCNSSRLAGPGEI